MSEYIDPYRDENGVMLNKLGIKDEAFLLKLEAEITSSKIANITTGAVRIQTKEFDLARLQEIHKFLFGSLYEWAGKLREAASAKDIPGTEFVGVFTAPSKIAEEWKDIEIATAKFASSKGMSLEDKLNALTDIFIAANNTHPFVEGNGRTLQLFMTQLAAEQGIVLDFTKIRDDNAMKSAWNFASAMSGVYGLLSEDQSGSDNWVLEKSQPSDKKGIKLFLEHIAKESHQTPASSIYADNADTALWRAIKSCSLKDLSEALEAGANPDAKDQANIVGDKATSKTPLLYTCEHLGDNFFGEGIAELLIDGGANVSPSDNQGGSPLILAAESGWKGAVKALLLHNANPNEVDQRNGNTALHVAASYGDKDTVAILLEHSANPHQKNNSGETPLDIATHKRERIEEVAHILTAAMQTSQDYGIGS